MKWLVVVGLRGAATLELRAAATRHVPEEQKVLSRGAQLPVKMPKGKKSEIMLGICRHTLQCFVLDYSFRLCDLRPYNSKVVPVFTETYLENTLTMKLLV